MDTTHAPICQICGKDIVRRSKTGPVPRFTCSPECHERRSVLIRSERRQREAAAKPRSCSECGASVERKWDGERGGSWPKTCSAQCRTARKSRLAIEYAREVQMGERKPTGTNSKDGYRRVGAIPEHRIVMAQQLGRPLERWEVVHHRNGVRNDNRLENLELWIKGQPAGQRVEDIIRFMVAHYRDAVVAALKGE